MEKHFNIKRNAFTLAEILITLGIIGVVVALTIPNVLKNIERKDLESSFKKSYTVIYQAVTQMKANEGGVWSYYIQKNGGTGLSLKNNIMKYFKVLDNCCSNSACSNNTCDPTNLIKYSNFPKKVYINTAYLSNYRFYTLDEMLIFINVYGSPNDKLSFFVDTNGAKKGPNRAGYDLFLFQIMPDDRVLPMGTPNTMWSGSWDCSLAAVYSATVTNGFSCAYRATYEKDYFKNLP